MQLKILNSKEKKNIAKMVSQQFGLDFTFDYEVFMNQKNKIFIMNKDISEIDIDALRINSLGNYFGEINQSQIRLSIEGAQIIGPVASKNVLELSDIDAKRWMRGEDFDVDFDTNAFVIVKHENDYLGCGRVSKNKLLNYVQKERRV